MFDFNKSSRERTPDMKIIEPVTSVAVSDEGDSEELYRLNQLCLEALNKLEAADPFTQSRRFGSGDATDESGARVAIESVTANVSAQLKDRLMEEFFGCGPLTDLFTLPCTEIIVNGRESIWYELNGKLLRYRDSFLSDLSYRNFISRVSREANMIASLDCPFADGSWRNMRVHLIIPPASGDQPVMTLRRHSANPWTYQRLQELEWATPKQFECLEDLVRDQKNFLVIGGTGSGKTSVLNACLNSIRDEERAVIIEDTNELRAPNAASTKLLSRRDPQGHLRDVDQSELLRQALRMRPDRIIMGEIRGGEAKDLLMAFATGHSGCMGTLHADTARQALLRLEMLIQIGAPQWNVHAVRSLIHLSLHAIVVVGRSPDGKRRLNGIYRVAALEDIGFLIEQMA